MYVREDTNVAKTQIVCSTNTNDRLTNLRDEFAIILSDDY